MRRRIVVNSMLIAAVTAFYGLNALPVILATMGVILALEWLLFAFLRWRGIDYRGEIGGVRN